MSLFFALWFWVGICDLFGELLPYQRVRRSTCLLLVKIVLTSSIILNEQYNVIIISYFKSPFSHSRSFLTNSISYGRICVEAPYI